MQFRKFFRQFLVFALLFTISTATFAAVESKVPLQYRVGYDLQKYANKTTFLKFMDNTIRPKLIALSRERGGDDDKAAKIGRSVMMKIDNDNYIYHVNYPNGERGGRSYGWTRAFAKADDWSDKTYLRELDKVVRGDETQMGLFYKSIIQLIGNCDGKTYPELGNQQQLVATNFLAIYAAEQYRALVGRSRWDDALFQVTMVAALHGGQKGVVKFYEGKFSSKAYDQNDRVYRKPKGNAEKRSAMLIDYWQFAKTGNRSGINLTRRDFELMGQGISRFMKRNEHFKKIKGMVNGDGRNIFTDIADYFIENDATRLSGVDELATEIAAFLVDVRRQAEDITQYVRGKEALDEDEAAEE